MIGTALVASVDNARAGGYGYAEVIGPSHTVFRALAQRSSADTNFVTVGRSWSGAQYKGLIAAFRISDGGQDLAFASSSGTPGLAFYDFAASGYDNLCGAVTYAYDGYIAACRSMNFLRYYDIYLVKFDTAGNLDTTFGAFTASGTLTSGSNAVTGLTSMEGIVIGSRLSGTGIPTGAKVVTVSAGGFVMSASATASGSQTITFAGVKATGLGGNGTLGHAFPRGLAYNSAGGTTANGGVVALVGGIGFYSPGDFVPFLATFDQKTGTQVLTTKTLSSISGTAVGVVFDGTFRGGATFNHGSVGAPGYYYMASTETTGTRNFYVDRYDSALNRSTSPWGDAIDFSAAGGGTDSVPAGITIFGNNVVTVGGNRAGAAAWKCTAAGLSLDSGALDTTFGESLTGPTSKQGIVLFNNPTSSSYDCILNAVATPPMGGYLLMSGTAYNGTNYDFLAAEVDSTGYFVSSFGTSGKKLQSLGVADDVLSSMSQFGNVAKVYAVGRSQSASLVNAGSLSEVTTTVSLTDKWTATTTTNAPTGRYSPSSVWTGSKLVIWGGCSVYPCSPPLNSGSQYDPVANNWTATTTTNAPAGRRFHATAWTGTKMLVWGGDNDVTDFNSGGEYDPSTNKWTPLTTTNAPAMRTHPKGVWTGTKLLVWGGANAGNTGGLYDPNGGTWTAISTTNAPAERWAQGTAWTGSKLIVWGGSTGSGFSNEGGVYDPSGDTWSIMTTVNAPSIRQYPSVTWTGTKMLVWGGLDSVSLNTGGLYDPASNTWTPTTTTNAPSIRDSMATAWTGTRMLVFGGQNAGVDFLNTGGIYDPSANSWNVMTTANAPAKVEDSAGVWTGSQLLVWGGDNAGYPNTGGIYTPISGSGSGGTFTALASNSWTTMTTTNAPSQRISGTGVWIGAKMIVWGGANAIGYVNSGGQYDPVTNSWTATSTANAPSVRAGSTAAWTGSQVVYWGGFSDVDGYLNTGGLYDPNLDSWTATSTTNAPAPRICGAGLWTGSRLVILAGADSGAFNDGGQYDPVGNNWTATSTANAPSKRSDVSAVWNGKKVIVWGGTETSSYFNDGGQYDPFANSWTKISTTNAPSERWGASGVWTGTKFIAWAGTGATGVTNTGGQYDPESDGWTVMTTVNAPTERLLHQAVWTGDRLIVWGGFGASEFGSGGRYDPVTDTWTETTTTNAPSARYQHTSVWTGSEMLIWGGLSTILVNTGGIYKP